MDNFDGKNLKEFF